MFVLPSKVKARVGRALYLTVMGARRLVGSTDSEVVCTRTGIHWHLDLNEALELGIYALGAFEPTVRRACDLVLREGMIALDVGANVGSHGLYMGKLVGSTGKVYAFEPTTYAFEKLCRNVDLNRWAKGVVVPVHAFVGDQATVAPREIYSSWDLSQLEAGHPDHGGQFKSAEGADTVTIDDFVRKAGLSRVDLLKIDVDGFETAVIRGASQTLRTLRPKIILEVCEYTLRPAGSSAVELLRALADLGYGFRTLRMGALPSSPEALAREIPSDGIVNVLAVPEDVPRAEASPRRVANAN